jgi:hypothetical protein
VTAAAATKKKISIPVWAEADQHVSILPFGQDAQQPILFVDGGSLKVP